MNFLLRLAEVSPERERGGEVIRLYSPEREVGRK